MSISLFSMSEPVFRGLYGLQKRGSLWTISLELSRKHLCSIIVPTEKTRGPRITGRRTMALFELEGTVEHETSLPIDLEVHILINFLLVATH